jgi:hypothetical protein
MNINVDNNYINKYLDEQAERNHERTRAIHIANKKEEIPYILAKLGAISFLILCIGFALKNSNSFTQEVLHKTIAEKGGITQQLSSPRKDVLIDIERLLSESKGTEKKFPDPSLSEDVPAEVVRNYVIFDDIPFNHPEITKVTVGRQYDNPDSEYSEAWCYISRKSDSGLRDTLFLKEIDEEGTETLEITDQIALDFGLSKEVAMEAQSLCTI